MKKTVLFTLLTLFVFQPAFPGSFLSLNTFGKLNSSGDIRTMSMSAYGIALYDATNSSVYNPSSATASDKIILNIGETFSSLSMEYDRFSDFSPESSDFDSPYINIIFPLPVKGLVFTADYMSPVNSTLEMEYSYLDEDIEETHEKNLNTTTFSLAYRTPFNISLSAGVIYAFGNERNQYLITNDSYTASETYNKWKYTYSGIGSKFGLHINLDNINAGVVYRPSYMIESSRSFNDTPLLPHTEFDYPSELAAGIALNLPGLTLTGEYVSCSWSSLDYYDYDLEDMTRYSLGGEFELKIPYERRGKEKIFRLPLRAGFYTQNGYYNDGSEFGVTMGFSLHPFKTSESSRVDILFSAGKRSAVLTDAFDGLDYDYSENFFTIGMSFSASDKWFR